MLTEQSSLLEGVLLSLCSVQCVQVRDNNEYPLNLPCLLECTTCLRGSWPDYSSTSLPQAASDRTTPPCLSGKSCAPLHWEG